MKLTQNQREYLKLIAEVRDEHTETEWVEEDRGQLIKPSPEEARQYLDKNDFTQVGIDDGYAKRPDKLDEKVNEKVTELPERIHSLAEDVELLNEAGYLNLERWGPHWINLLDTLEIEGESLEMSENMYSGNSPQEAFGQRLGEMVYLLMLYPKGVGKDNFSLGIIRGFISGFTGRMPADRSMEFLTQVSELLEEDIENQKEWYRSLSKGLPDWFSDVEEDINSCIEEYLREEGYEISESLIHSVRVAIQDEYEEGERLSFAVGRDGTPSEGEWDVEEVVTKKRVTEVIQKRDLYRKDQLSGVLSDDLDRFFSVEHGGICAHDVIVNTSEGSTVKEVAERVSEQTDEQVSSTLPIVAKLARYLSLEEDRHLGQRKERKVVTLQDSGDMNDWVIDLTSYGRLVKENVSPETVQSIKSRERDDIAKPWDIVPLEVPSSLLDEAIDQVGL
jgi:hypothetical protein